MSKHFIHNGNSIIQFGKNDFVGYYYSNEIEDIDSVKGKTLEEVKQKLDKYATDNI